LGLPACNVEPLQVVAYTGGQEFKEHHDIGTLAADGSVEAVAPRRLATIFVYLNTLPMGQGHTEFPQLGLSITPKQRQALLFSNVCENGQPDAAAVHCARPVYGKHIKLGLNIWVTDSNLRDLAITTPGPPALGPSQAGRGVKRRKKAGP
ncbi:unnamed protein product, partial [Polarella glacialis]